ncbi:MAG: hypothetical protein DRJ03_12475 [Chloroflexi bacterium]|nr:MAG: hypothetical protein B6I35_04595 [Anaerolineaceae bacterium 4572_32.2]RLC79294.1 MAG: hypothetical protein DRI81_05510 [Chloroflexota bacterium]RLC85143.1 MAG: hypothetical protein DRJ03_12475 [Chloroflexota bacterium]HEY72217.1 hypothetical protein [Thermoflexia bacterium]
MPTLVDLLERVSFLAAMPAVAGIFVTAGILVVSRDWRINSLALTVQYFFVVLLLSRLIRLEVAAVKGLIGWLICMVFYLTERRVSTLEQPSPVEESTMALRRWSRWIISAQASFYLLAGILISVAAYTAALRIPLPEVPGDITLACYLLAGLGLLLVGLSDNPMQVGLGLLTFLSGFELFYVALEPSLAIAGLLGAVSFLIALAAAYLRTAQIAASREAVS